MKFIDPTTLKSREEIIDLYKFYSNMELQVASSDKFDRSLVDAIAKVTKAYAEEIEKGG